MRPVLLYDAGCAFCRRWVERFRARTGDRVRYVRSDLPGVRRWAGVGTAEVRRSVVLREPGGRVRTGAGAIFATLRNAPGLRAAATLALLPPVRIPAELAYRAIARHRRAAARIDRLVFAAGPPSRRRGRVRTVRSEDLRS